MDYFGFYCDHFVHEIVKTGSGNIVMIDVCETPDCGWEGAYAIFDEEAFRDWWDDYGNEDGIAGTPYTFENIKDWGEEADAFYGWMVVSNRHRKPETAERNLRKFVAKL